MARVATRKKETHALQEAAWRKLLETTDFAGLDADARADAWTVLAWAEKHAVLSTPPTPVPAEKAEMERVVAAVLALIATPPAGVDAAERIARAAGWAARTNHPLVHALHGVLCAENAQMKAALEVFEKLKCVGSAFPEVSLVVGRALLAQAGRDSKLLHRAEWWLQHAEHLHLDGDSEIEAEEDAENSDDP
ncbi:MAG: hypothetical protein FJX76_01390, partial [Armatimonadetes bacterium]|nr:hypothetical protein [Armatimonadota bacterium]